MTGQLFKVMEIIPIFHQPELNTTNIQAQVSVLRHGMEKYMQQGLQQTSQRALKIMGLKIQNKLHYLE